MGKKLSQVGGMKHSQLIKEWKDSDWPFKINVGDVNSELVHRKKKDLEKENCKHPVYMLSHSTFQNLSNIYGCICEFNQQGLAM